MKKMYNQPTTEVLSVNTERMMQDPVVSGTGNASENPTTIFDGD